MPARPDRSRLAPLIAVALIPFASCARQAAPVAVADVAAVAPPKPTLPPGYSAVVPPARDAGGGYRTINSGLDAPATLWHVRAALNVAAIGCRGPEAAAIVPAYNAMLASRKKALDRAHKSVQAAIQVQAGKGWQAADDVAMTRLYNYFAMPAAKPAFCAAASEIATQVGAVPAAGLDAFAASALPALEAPFLAVYRTVDDHRVALAAWEVKYGAGAPVQLAATTPPVAGAVADVDAKPRKAPRLAYADMREVIAFVPRKGQAFAER